MKRELRQKFAWPSFLLSTTTTTIITITVTIGNMVLQSALHPVILTVIGGTSTTTTTIITIIAFIDATGTMIRKLAPRDCPTTPEN